MIYESEDDELVLIGSVVSLTNPDPDILDRITPEHFSGIRSEIWRIASVLRAEGKPVTPRAITAQCGNASAITVLSNVAGRPFTSTRVRSAEATVRELARMRRLDGAITAIRERAEAAETYSEALEAAHAELARLEASEAPSEVRDFADAVEDWFDWLESPADGKTAIPTPWEGLNDKLAGGLHRGRTYVIGGRPGEGKSVAGSNLAVYAAEHGHPSALFSVEMPEREIVSRIMASGAQAEYGQITKRNVDDRNFAKLAEYKDSYQHIPLKLIDKSDISVEYIAAVCRTLKRTRGLDVVFVDYLQLLRETDGKLSRERQVAQMSRGLKILSRELDCAVIIACQLNRSAANEKRPPVLADLRESGAIEQDCDVAILLHHIVNEDGRTGDVDLVVAKNRTGSCGSVLARFKGYQARIA